MKTIWKFPLAIARTQRINMPEGAMSLHVAVQDTREPAANGIRHVKTLTLWALVEGTAEVEERAFTVVGTGHPVPDGGYIGSAMMDELVWHVFEERKP